jgi:hypothetical protein
MFLRFILIIAVLALPLQTFSQRIIPVIFFEVIKGDSVMLFFDDQQMFTDRHCASYIRFTRLDAQARFHGYFEDVSNENVLQARGYYEHGLRQGYFETYYQNGKVKWRGSYNRNIPEGVWQHFYLNGMPERTLTFTETDTLLTRFVDRRGNVTVESGNGWFKGYVSAQLKIKVDLLAWGDIVNGKAHGKWESRYYDTYCKEFYEHGKFIKGNFPEEYNHRYTSGSHLNQFMLRNYLPGLEKFEVKICRDSCASIYDGKYLFDIQRFNTELRTLIPLITTKHFATGNNFLSIQFRINAEGKPEAFKMISPWGADYYPILVEFINTHGSFPIDQKTMYFHMRLSIREGRVDWYDYSFSTERENKLK